MWVELRLQNRKFALFFVEFHQIVFIYQPLDVLHHLVEADGDISQFVLGGTFTLFLLYIAKFSLLLLGN